MHNEGNSSSFTSKYRPWTFFAALQFRTRAAAMDAEKYLKKKPRDFIQRIPNDPELQNYIIKKFDN
jgi:predicted GIY-YIG superfamily endonuclease